jgi:2-keto-4-pentenoate hydratase/2-oxohepta-3-ene-1,7-dioic acid hydratase in catechol pathway
MLFARCVVQGDIRYGLVEGDTLHLLEGNIFSRYQRTRRSIKLGDVRLLSPVAPRKLLAMALNYPSHLAGREAPKRPEPFLKAPSAVIGPGDPIVLPKEAGRVDAEGELVAVIGKPCRRVSPQEALDYVFGYTCGNDVSAREWQNGDIQWWRAKSSDTFAPLGPFLVTRLDPRDLELRVRIDGVEVQRGNTGTLLYDVPTIVSFISQVVTLEPGDVIFTGTPGRTGTLKPGGYVEVEIQGIGVLRNPVRTEE